jgi:hypothetical protein
MIYKRGNSLWYKFRWMSEKADGTTRCVVVRRRARVKTRKDAKSIENEHRRALSMGLVHPRDPWPKPFANGPPTLRAFAKEFLQHAKSQTRQGTHGFYSGCLNRLLTFAAIADASLDTITGDVVSRYARHRQEVARNSVVTVNGDLRTLRRVLHLAVDWGRIPYSPAIHEIPQPKGRERVISFAEEAHYLAKASVNLRDAAILQWIPGCVRTASYSCSSGPTWT